MFGNGGNKWRCGSACWFAVGFRPCRCFDRQAQTLGTPKGSELGDSMSWREQRQKSQSWNCGYEPSSRRTNMPSGFVIRRGHCTASFRSSRLLPSPLISTVDYRNEAIGGAALRKSRSAPLSLRLPLLSSKDLLLLHC